MKKIISNAGIIVGLIFTAFILFSVLYVWKNERHDVEFFAGSNHKYYENTPDAAQIQVSPALAWKQVSVFNKSMGWIFLVLIWVALWFVTTDRHLGKRKANDPYKEANGIAVFIIALPLVLCAVFFFAGYSSKYSNNYVVVERSQFDSWINTGAIEQKGAKTYIDKADTIKPYFNKKFIQ
jgi:hypothetical protein